MRGGRPAKKQGAGEPVVQGSCDPNAETQPIVAALQVYGPLVHFMRSRPTVFHCDYKRPEDAHKALAATIEVNGKPVKLKKGKSVTQRATAPPKVPPAIQAAAIEEAKRKSVERKPKSRAPVKRGEVFVASISKYTSDDELKRQLSVLGTLVTFRHKEESHYAFASFQDMDIIYEQIDAAAEDGAEFGVYDDAGHLMPIVRSTKPPPRSVRESYVAQDAEEEENQEQEEEKQDEPNEEKNQKDSTGTSEESKPSTPVQPLSSGSDSESSSSEAPYAKPPQQQRQQQQRAPAAAVIPPPVTAVVASTTAPRPGVVVCHACKAPNMEGNVFCSSCGERRASPTTCLKCSTENLPGFRFCNMCGAQPPPPPPPPAVMPKGDELLRLYLAEKGASDYFAAIRDLVEKFAARK